MRRSDERSGAERAAGDRGGMLLVPEQHPARHDPPGQASPAPVSVELLVAFTRQLVRHTLSRDALHLSLLVAASEIGVSQEEATRLLNAVLAERERSFWPPNF